MMHVDTLHHVTSCQMSKITCVEIQPWGPFPRFTRRTVMWKWQQTEQYGGNKPQQRFCSFIPRLFFWSINAYTQNNNINNNYNYNHQSLFCNRQLWTRIKNSQSGQRLSVVSWGLLAEAQQSPSACSCRMLSLAINSTLITMNSC